MHLTSLSYDQLVAHGVTPSFAEILTEPVNYHPSLDILIGRTNWDYFIPAGVIDIVPLWDSNADSFVRWNRNGEIEYVWLFHDDPNWTLIAHSEQGVMAELWQSWVEFQETDEEAERFAKAIGFRHWAEGLALWNKDYDQLEPWRLSLTD